ncbi:hypothetical protein TgHK011_006576 [Trichoderma gracile]|nr:hypothetical protein TgHK011_006576 [Trichoderma gracile]
MLLPVSSQRRSQGSQTGFRVLYRQNSIPSPQNHPASGLATDPSSQSQSQQTLELHRQADRSGPLREREAERVPGALISSSPAELPLFPAVDDRESRASSS